MIPHGVTFHVGSQCLEKTNWLEALKRARTLFKASGKEGIELRLLNIGGGLPVEHTHEIPSIEEVGETAMKTVHDLFDQSVEINLEPGRAMVGNSAVMVATVIGKAERSGRNWLYLDAGVLQGLMETVGGIKYEVRTGRESEKLTEYMLAGPTCDSFDKMFTCRLPDDLEAGDRLYILNAGAYTTAYASNFDGFKTPEVYYLDK